MTMQLTPHFTLAEATRSDAAREYGVSNEPGDDELQVLIATAMNMEHVRRLLDGSPVLITSWFRSERINGLVGGVSTSAHRLGYAVDFHCPAYGGITEICRAIDASCLQYDQLIWERGVWCHISFDPRMRRQNLTTRDTHRYQSGLPDD